MNTNYEWAMWSDSQVYIAELQQKVARLEAELKQYKDEEAAKSKISDKTHWRTAQGQWIYYPDLEDSHLLNIFKRMDVYENKRLPYVLQEISRRWGRLWVYYYGDAREVVCAGAADWAAKRGLYGKCTLAKLIEYFDCPEKGDVQSVMVHVIKKRLRGEKY